jgi:O-antigen ligase
MYFRHVARVLRRNAVVLVALAGVAAFALTSNDAFMEKLQSGVGRVATGIEVLQSRDDVEGYSALDSRGRWLRDGLTGWAQSPLFGHGVEGFRGRFGMTSHSTPVDLLYNSGLIGFGLFYGMFISMAWRLFQSRDARSSGVGAVVFGALVCYLFITLSGTMYYNAFLAVFIAISTPLLGQHRLRNPRSRVSPEAAHS